MMIENRAAWAMYPALAAAEPTDFARQAMALLAVLSSAFQAAGEIQDCRRAGATIDNPLMEMPQVKVADALEGIETLVALSAVAAADHLDRCARSTGGASDVKEAAHAA